MNYCICFIDSAVGRSHTKMTSLPLPRIGDRVLATLPNENDKQLQAVEGVVVETSFNYITNQVIVRLGDVR